MTGLKSQHHDAGALTLLQPHKQRFKGTPTKYDPMVDLGEAHTEVYQVARDLRAHDLDRLTLGQYLQPTRFHSPAERYVRPKQFKVYVAYAKEIGFEHPASAPLVRSSFHADLQAAGQEVS